MVLSDFGYIFAKIRQIIVVESTAACFEGGGVIEEGAAPVSSLDESDAVLACCETYYKIIILAGFFSIFNDFATNFCFGARKGGTCLLFFSSTISTGLLELLLFLLLLLADLEILVKLLDAAVCRSPYFKLAPNVSLAFT